MHLANNNASLQGRQMGMGHWNTWKFYFSESEHLRMRKDGISYHMEKNVFSQNRLKIKWILLWHPNSDILSSSHGSSTFIELISTPQD